MRNKKSIKIVVKGAYGDANVGDDLLLEIVLEVLNRLIYKPNIVVVCRKEQYLLEKFKDVKFISLAASRFFQSDVYILGGGTQFFSFKNSNSNRTLFSKIKIYFEIIKKEPSLLFSLLSSAFKGTNKEELRLALGVGLGPFVSVVDELNVKKVLSSFDQIYCRDNISLSYLDEWQLGNSFFGADLCLTTIFNEKYTLKHNRSFNNKIKIGLVLRDWPHNEVGDVINNKLFYWIDQNSHYEVLLFIFSESKDRMLIDRIEGKIDFKVTNVIIWDPLAIDFDEFYSILNSCDIILTSRYHAAIFALNLEIPTVCLGIDPKLQALCEEVQGFYYWEANEDLSVLDNYINEINSNYLVKQSLIKNSYPKLNKRADMMIERIITELNKL